MAITTSTSGIADNDTIIGMQIIRTPATGDLAVEVHYAVGESSKQLTLTPSESFKTQIEATYAEIKATINEAEGLA